MGCIAAVLGLLPFVGAILLIYVLTSRRQAKIHQLVEHLAGLARLSMPLQTGLRMVAADLGGIVGGRIDRLARRLEDGAPVDQAIAAVPGALPPFLGSMLAMGEKTGNLAGFLEETRRSYHRIAVQPYQSAYIFLYPLVLTLFIGALLLTLTASIAPKFHMILEHLNLDAQAERSTLGWSRLVMFDQAVLALAVLALVFLFMGGVSVHFRSGGFALFKPVVDRVVLVVPGLRRLLRNGSLHSLAFATGLALRAGARLPEALEAAARSEGNAVFRKRYLRLAAEAAQGRTLSQAGQATRLFPDDLRWFVETGETTCKLPEYLLLAADHYEAKVRYAAQRALKMTLPFFVLLNGGIVFGAAFLTFLPIREMLLSMVHVPK